ncbi:hypothetical protein G7046_g1492 [Stylonectria norvegica]|nr:hypothetical protein G7046_g1492 [Stylonectria norvegica]
MASQSRPSTSRRRPPIFRVKTGCFTCRGRKKKCDEVKPCCAGCRRNNLNCRWPTSAQSTRKSRFPESPDFEVELDTQDQDNTAQTPDRNVASCASPTHQVTTSMDIFDEEPALDTIVVSDGFSPETSSSQSSYDTSTPSPDVFLGINSPSIVLDVLPSDNGQVADDTADEMIVELFANGFNAKSLLSVQPSPKLLQSGWNAVPQALSPFPCQDGKSLDLLSHYLSRTAMSMGNDSTDVNPFISQLVPLCFANSLILDLVLCQSAAHRAMEDATKLEIAHKYYNKSLRMIRQSIQDYVDGHETNPLWIVVGALIMCFTETAKGDTQGSIFDHINGAGPLLTNFLSRSNAVSDDLKNFIIEYYMNTVSISMISIDPTSGSMPFLSPELERQGDKLVEASYVGQLCGGWLELLLLLPRVFRFGQRLRNTDTEPRAPTADDFMIFSTLQARVLSFQPLPYLGSDVTLCSEIFKQAIHLYLLTALTGRHEDDGPMKHSIDNTIDQAFRYLGQLPATSRVNTSLCWALGVIGSCVTDEDRRNELRARLDIMFVMIGLGNILATSTLLEHMWALPIAEQSPWAIWRVMRENQVWISFA